MPIYARIPWGGGKDTTYANGIFTLYSPKHLRKYQGTPYLNSFVGDERYGAINEQVLRPGSIERSSKFWVALYGYGLLIPPLFILLVLMLCILSPIVGLMDLLLDTIVMILEYAIFPAIIALIIGYITVNYMPFLSRRKGVGTKWELNRKTGMVTNFTYGSPGRVIFEESVPFYECDAYLWSTPARYGMTHTVTVTATKSLPLKTC